jgi:hypothetical protein
MPFISGEMPGIGGPLRRSALADTAIVEQLHLEPTGIRDLTKHLGLEPHGHIPGLMPALGGIEGEDDPSPATTAVSGKLPNFGEEALEF